MQIDVHAATVPVLSNRSNLVLIDTPTMSSYSRCDLSDLLAYLVLHEQTHYSDYSRKDHAAFDLHLVLHHVPGHSRDRRGCIRRRRRRLRVRLRRIERLAPPTITIVVAIRGAPRSVRRRMSRSLAFDRAARPLSITYSRIRQKPSAADRARSLFPHSDIYDHPPRSASWVGHFCQADQGQFSRAVPAK
jgi:hypothetical protein